MVLLDCSVFSFLLQAAVISKVHNASMPTVIILQLVFLFMMSPFLVVVENLPDRLLSGNVDANPRPFYRDPPLGA
jgi:hypothetical protein